MMLFIDIGNSRIKYALNKHALKLQWTMHKDIECLYAYLIEHCVSKIVITKGRSSNALQSFDRVQHFANSHQILLQEIEVRRNFLTINYIDTSQFGCDRFLNLLGAKQRYKEYFCIVSCGTAITLDFYTHKHIGGMILPGLGTARSFLNEKNGLYSIEKPTLLLGSDTATCIGAGLYFGYQNLIYSSIKRVAESIDKTFTTVLTGGDAECLSKNDEVIETLLFEGMQIYVKLSEGS